MKNKQIKVDVSFLFEKIQEKLAASLCELVKIDELDVGPDGVDVRFTFRRKGDVETFFGQAPLDHNFAEEVANAADFLHHSN